MTNLDSIVLDEDAFNFAVDLGKITSAAGLDFRVQASEVIKAYLRSTGIPDKLSKLNALEMFGVDNWEGYGDAMESLLDEDWHSILLRPIA